MYMTYILIADTQTRIGSFIGLSVALVVDDDDDDDDDNELI